ncbi:Class II abasic (AP) endonuclease [Nowakowskiella sp. JEL0407]|nr:Class II abasic (AP) endonuclease [Nowakowskiella sp. JEL0407]
MELYSYLTLNVQSFIQSQNLDFKQFIFSLNADIICFQETKINSKDISEEYKSVDGYYSFFSCSKKRSGYSGVAVFIKTTIPICGYEEGFTGILSEEKEIYAEFSEINQEFEQPLLATINSSKSGDMKQYMKALSNLDSEGRCIEIDCGGFTLLNVYFPTEPSEERHDFKIAFSKGIQKRVEALVKIGREVILVGDVNVCHKEIDHCDPEKSKKERNITDFGSTPSRKWINEFLAPNGSVVDLFRHFNPEKRHAFTCWNTLINARASNYGTRIDYILVTPNLLKFFTSCEIQSWILGSDHCPVTAEFLDSLITDFSDEVEKREQQITPNTQQFEKEISDSDLVNIGLEWGEDDVDLEIQADWNADDMNSEELGKEFEITDSVPSHHNASRNSLENPPKVTFHSPKAVLPSTKTPRSNGAMKSPTKPSGGVRKQQTKLTSFLTKSTGSTNSPLPFDKNLPTQTKLTSFFIKKSDSDAKPPLPSTSTARNSISSSNTTLSKAGSTETASDVQKQWNKLLTKPAPPRCYHGEPCKELTVNKSGKNKGRMFYMCSRLVGPETEKIGEDGKRLKRTLNEFRCDFFQWKVQTNEKVALKSEGSEAKKKSFALFDSDDEVVGGKDSDGYEYFD